VDHNIDVEVDEVPAGLVRASALLGRHELHGRRGRRGGVAFAAAIFIP
jgi:hypothetical protein